MLQNHTPVHPMVAIVARSGRKMTLMKQLKYKNLLEPLLYDIFNS